MKTVTHDSSGRIVEVNETTRPTLPKRLIVAGGPADGRELAFPGGD